MKIVFVVLIILSLCIACQNLCNGHGECDTGDKCVCFPGWGGSEWSCPYSDAFIDLLPGDLDHDGTVTTGDDDHVVKTEWNPIAGTNENVGKEILTAKRAHRYAECSNVGTCDRGTGLCECYSGFEGSACQRRSCPTSSEGSVCSGHGMCMSSEASIIHKGKTALPSGWEYEKFGVCVCDKGWTGISCGSRICPKGLDPVTKGSYIYSFEITETTAALFPTSGNDPAIISHYYEMEYDGVKYTTPVIPALTGICDNGNLVASKSSEAAEDIRRALVSIPPLSQSKVSFKCGSNAVVASITISTPYIELDLKEDNSGSGSCTSPGDQSNQNPYYNCEIKLPSGSGNLKTTTKPSSFKVYSPNGVTPPTSVGTIKFTMTATSKSVDFKNDANPPTTATPINDKVGFISCSGRGNCNADSGLCECFDGFSGVACEKQRNN